MGGVASPSFWLLHVVMFGCYCLLASFCLMGSVQSTSSPTTDCTSELPVLAPCLTYVEPNNHDKPDSACCKSLETFVNDSPACLCQLASGGNSSATGVTVNATRAQELPSLCSVKLPASAASCTGASSSPSSNIQSTPTSKANKSSSNGHPTVLISSWTAVTFSSLVYSLVYL
eukprot:c43307_g1_i1 orf=332-850(-)